MRSLAILLLVCISVMAVPLSVRNNNAGNIKFIESNKWIGQIGSYKGFVKFDTKEHGMRASKIVIIKNIQATHSVNCFVMRYASEPSDGISSAHLVNYANAIKKLVGRNYLLKSDADILLPLLIKLEGGNESVKYFLGKDNELTKLSRCKTCKKKRVAKTRIQSGTSKQDYSYTLRDAILGYERKC